MTVVANVCTPWWCACMVWAYFSTWFTVLVLQIKLCYMQGLISYYPPTYINCFINFYFELIPWTFCLFFQLRYTESSYQLIRMPNNISCEYCVFWSPWAYFKTLFLINSIQERRFSMFPSILKGVSNNKTLQMSY